MKGRCGRRLSWTCTVEAWAYNRSMVEVITWLCLPSPSPKDIHATHTCVCMYMRFNILLTKSFGLTDNMQYPPVLLTICNTLQSYWQCATPSSPTDNVQLPPVLLTMCNTLQSYWQCATPSSPTDNVQHHAALLTMCNTLQPYWQPHCAIPSTLLAVSLCNTLHPYWQWAIAFSRTVSLSA